MIREQLQQPGRPGDLQQDPEQLQRDPLPGAAARAAGSGARCRRSARNKEKKGV